MKRYLCTILLASMLLPAVAICEEFEDIEQIERQMEIRNMELEMAQRESEVRFEEEMRNLKLEQARVEIENQRKAFGLHGRRGGPMCGIFVLCFIIHILVAIWVYKDIHQRNCGSGLWIWITLLAGVLGAIAYAIIRLGDGDGKKVVRK